MNKETFAAAMGEIDGKYLTEAENYKGHKVFSLKKCVLIAAAVLVLFAFSVTGLAAAGNDTAYGLLYNITPSVAQRLKPVNMSCESNGIRAEVTAADIDGDTAHICLSLRDIQGERIDGTIDLFDSYKINTPYDMSGTCSFSGYDEKTGEARFLITLSTMNGEPMKKEKVTFSFTKLLTGKKTSAGTFDIDTRKLSDSPAVKTLTQNGTELTVLEEAPELMRGETDAVLSAAGFVDGKLRIQTRYKDFMLFDNHGWVLPVTGDGTADAVGAPVIFDSPDGVYRYYEQTFEVAPEQAEDMSLQYEFVTCDTLLTGFWQVTFSL